MLEFVIEFVFDCKVEVCVEFVPDVDTLELEDEFVLDVLEDPWDVEVEFVTVEVEFPESVEKAYCGKTSIAASEMMNRTFRSILLYILNSLNKELLHIVQEQCY